MTDGEPVVVSVILPVRNGEPFFRTQLEALERQSCSFPWRSSSSTTARPMGRRPRLESSRLVSRTSDCCRRTRRASRWPSTAASGGAGKHLIFVDADDEAGEGYIEKMSGALGGSLDLVGVYLDTETLNPRRAVAAW